MCKIVIQPHFPRTGNQRYEWSLKRRDGQVLCRGAWGQPTARHAREDATETISKIVSMGSLWGKSVEFEHFCCTEEAD